MKKYSIISSFESLPIDFFWYPAKEESNHTVLLLKGLYGLHDPKSRSSWDVELINSCSYNYNFICINTARKGRTKAERSKKEAFELKTFKQECDDIRRVYKYVVGNKILSSEHILYVISNSFGGTTLLGIPEIMKKASAVVMIGSGCGKNSQTRKPLLATLYEEEKLLKPLRSYKGIFIFIRGENDSVVPKKSQEKIISSSKLKSSIHASYVIHGARHDLKSNSISNKNVVDRTKIISSILKSVVHLSTNTIS